MEKTAFTGFVWKQVSKKDLTLLTNLLPTIKTDTAIQEISGFLGAGH